MIPEEPTDREPAVLTKRVEGSLIITLNRPEQRNAVNLEMAAGVAHALDELDASPDLRVGILTGAGKGFCAGMDLKAFSTGQRPHIDGRGFAGITRRSAAKPLIAAIEGFAVGGGLEIALACDILIAASDARLGIPEVRRSLVASGGALLRLPQSVPRNIAMELALTGDPINAERAYQLGLINRLVDPGATTAAALEMAEVISRGGPLATVASKRILVESPSWPESEFFARQEQIIGPVITSDDAREGAAAFAEKRSPIWRGD